MKLPESFYTREDVVAIAKDLLGKLLVTNFDGVRTAGIITETEAYAGENDRAAHSFGGRRTDRTETMYAKGGHAYVYLCYGIHHLFNVIVNKEDVPQGVLIRAIEPTEGIEKMLQRRGMDRLQPALTAGPGSMSRAMGIHTQHKGMSLTGDIIFIEDAGNDIAADDIVATTRVGVAYAGKDALLPYRFFIRNNKYVSKAKGL